MIKKVFLMLSVLTFFGLACDAPSKTPSSASENRPAPAPDSSKADWEKSWETVLADAKKEGRLVLYGSAGAPVHTPLTTAFKERYGISVEAIGATGTEILEKIKRERQAGLYQMDVVITGTGTVLTVGKPGGMLVPFESLLILPEVLDPKVWFDSKLPWIDKDHFILAFGLSPTTTWVINTEAIKPDEMRSYRDLLNPKLKGKITMADPTIGGAGNRWFSGVGDYITGYDYMRELAKQEPILMRDPRLLAEWVARGKYPVTIAPSFAPIAEFQKLGSPISWIIPLEGNTLTAGHGSISFIDKAPHPNASRVFINWLLSKEGLSVWTRAQNAQTARQDVSVDFLEPAMVRQPGIKYVNTENEEFLLKAPESYSLAKDIFGHLLGR